jgi:hypothetical protein
MFAAALAAWNFAAFIYPHAQVASDPILVLARQVNRELPRNATVYYRTLDPDDWYLEYFAPQRHWLGLPSDADATTLLHATAGPVCLETTALEGFRGTIDPSLKWDLVDGSHNVRLECLKRPQ